MAAPVQALEPLKVSVAHPVTQEQKYWKSFKNQLLHTSTAAWPISHISFPSAIAGVSAVSTSLTTAVKNNDLFAVTAGPRVDLYSICKRNVIKTIGRFNSEAHSGCIRTDGRVLVAGENSGRMQVFDIHGKTRAVILKTWHVHKQPVWVTRWSPSDLTILLSASDDKTVRLWDLPSNDPTRTFQGHADYVRSGEFIPGSNSNLFVSGSYDQTVRVWDARMPGNSVLTFKHRDPIETVLPLPSGTTLLAAAGNTISVLDLVAAKLQRLITNHQKTVTALFLASQGKRVLSGGLDGHVKVFETTDWNVVAGSKYPSPILSLCVVTAGANNEDRHLAVGMQSGVLSLRTRLNGSAASEARTGAVKTAVLGKLVAQRTKHSRTETASRVANLLGEDVDAVICTAEPTNSRKRSRKKPQWATDFRHARYGPALDAVLDQASPTYDAIAAATLIQALRHRSALREALAGRDEITIQPVLKWITKHILYAKYRASCVDMALYLIDLYAEYVGSSDILASSFRDLLERVRKEIARAQVAIATNGMVESLMLGAATA